MKQVITCTEQGWNCMNKFIPTRIGQVDMCIQCMKMVTGEVPPLIPIKNNKWTKKI